MSPRRLDPNAQAFRPDAVYQPSFQDDRYQRLMAGMATGLGAAGWNLDDALSFEYFVYRPIACGENDDRPDIVRAAAKAWKLLGECRALPEVSEHDASAVRIMEGIIEDFPWSFGGAYTVQMRTDIYQHARQVLQQQKDLGIGYHEFNSRIQTCPGFAEFQKYDASRLIGQETALRDLIAAEYHWPWHALKKNPRTSVHMMKWYQRVFCAASYDTIVLEGAAPMFVFAQGFRRLVSPDMDMAEAGRYEMSVAKVMVKRVLADCAPEMHVLRTDEEELVRTYLTVVRDYREERTMHGEDATKMPPWDTQAETQRSSTGLVTRQDKFPFHGTRGPASIQYVGLPSQSGHELDVSRKQSVSGDVEGLRLSRGGESAQLMGLKSKRHFEPSYDLPRGARAMAIEPSSGQTRPDPFKRSREDDRGFEDSSNGSTPTPTPTPHLQTLGKDKLSLLDSSLQTSRSAVRPPTSHSSLNTASYPEKQFSGIQLYHAREPIAEQRPASTRSGPTPIGTEAQHVQKQRKQSLENLDILVSDRKAVYTQPPTTPRRRTELSEPSSTSGPRSQHSAHLAWSPISPVTQMTFSSERSGDDYKSPYGSLPLHDSHAPIGLGRSIEARRRLDSAGPLMRLQGSHSKDRSPKGPEVDAEYDSDNEKDFIFGPWAHRQSSNG